MYINCFDRKTKNYTSNRKGEEADVFGNDSIRFYRRYAASIYSGLRTAQKLDRGKERDDYYPST